MIDLTVLPCIVVCPMELSYTMFKGVVVLESWDSWIDWEMFLDEEIPLD
jgi:hypothetical protein